jgi:predicted dehydrogenase
MNHILNWGFLSTARINQSLIPALRISPQNNLHGVASRDPVKAREYALSNHIPQYYDSYHALLNDPEINVIYISLPNHLHAEWIINAANAGKHVLCEKPIAQNLQEMDAIIEASSRNKVVITEAFMYRHHPQTKKILELLKNRAIGDLLYIRGSFSFFLESSYDIRLDPEKGGGSIWDIGCYPINYSRLIAQSPVQEVFGWQLGNNEEVDTLFCGQMKFKNGIIAQFDSSFRSPLKAKIEICGTEGYIELPNPYKPYFNSKIIINREGFSNTINVTGEMLYLGEIEDIADAILKEKTPLISLEDSRDNTRTILAFIESAIKGKPVVLI